MTAASNTDADKAALSCGAFLAAIMLVLGCSAHGQLAEQKRQRTLRQISDIKNGKTSTLHDPAPSLIEEIVRDPACAENIELLGFTDIGPDLTDSRLRSLQRLPHVKGVYFYCTDNTDDFLASVSGMASLESLATELADVSDHGMKYVARCPKLKKLVLYGGRPSVGNAGLAELEGHEKLKTLQLINTDVTDEGLKSLTKLPSLRSLVLYWDADRGRRLTDAGLTHLKSLSQLEILKLTGGWVTENEADQLRSSLTGCKVDTTRLW